MLWTTLVSLLGKNPIESVKDLIQTFKLPPEQQLIFDTTMAKTEADLMVGLAKLDAEDRASARQRESSTSDTKNVFRLGMAITGGFFGVLSYMLVYDVPVAAERVIDVMLGSLGTAWIAVVSYYFGSSSGSAKKDYTISKLSQ